MGKILILEYPPYTLFRDKNNIAKQMNNAKAPLE